MRLSMTKLLLQAVMIVLPVGVIGVIVAGQTSQEPRQAAGAIIVAAVICLITALISVVPIVLAAQKGREWIGQAALAGTAIRLFLTLILGILAYLLLIEKDQRMGFALWTVGFYMALLIWETITAAKAVKLLYPGENKTGIGDKTD